MMPNASDGRILSARMNTDNHDESTAQCLLPPQFVPGPNHVICARGKRFWDHEGNKKYRKIIASATKKYAEAGNKLDKTLIVSEIVESVRNSNPPGGFVKLTESKTESGKKMRWIEVDDSVARMKVGQSLRDSLHCQYRSSTKAKKIRQTKVTEKIDHDINGVLHSNVSLAQRIEQLSKDVEEHGKGATDSMITDIFNRANSDILESIKKDKSLLTKYQDAVCGMEDTPSTTMPSNHQDSVATVVVPERLNEEYNTSKMLGTSSRPSSPRENQGS